MRVWNTKQLVIKLNVNTLPSFCDHNRQNKISKNAACTFSLLECFNIRPSLLLRAVQK
jgi:hypothetical protein